MAFHELTVAKVERVAEDAVAVTFDVPESAKGAFDWRPGQFLTLRTDVDGEDIRRSYSIASPPGGPLMVGIRAVEDGRFSTFAQGLEPGQRLNVMPPEGRFVSGDEEDLLLIAAGSGITPMMAIASDALARGAQVTLVYGNRALGTIMFRDRIDALKDKYLGQLAVLHLLSREVQDVPLFNGRIDAEKVSILAKSDLISPHKADGVFLCGPGEMIEEMRGALTNLGVAPERIHQERFTADGTAPPKPRSKAAEVAVRDGVTVEVVMDGARKRFVMGAEDGSVVDAAARAGLELPYSCKGGMCCTCRCRVTEGGTEMAVNYSLEPWEIDAGYTLACQSRPISKTLTLDFDAV